METAETPTRKQDTPIIGRKPKYSYATKFIAGNNEEDSYIEMLQDNIRLVKDVNKNNLNESPNRTSKFDKNLLRHGFPKILCLKKTNGQDRTGLKTLNVNTLDQQAVNKSVSKTTNISKEGNYYTEKPKNRNSFHQNVEEALSSLLWQPYEYQNQNNNDYSLISNGNQLCDYESSHYSTW